MAILRLLLKQPTHNDSSESMTGSLKAHASFTFQLQPRKLEYRSSSSKIWDCCYPSHVLLIWMLLFSRKTVHSSIMRVVYKNGWHTKWMESHGIGNENDHEREAQFNRKQQDWFAHGHFGPFFFCQRVIVAKPWLRSVTIVHVLLMWTFFSNCSVGSALAC